MKLGFILLTLAGLIGCQQPSEDLSPEQFKHVKKAESVKLSMLILRSGKLWAFNPEFHTNVLRTRYSERVEAALRPFITAMPASCFAAGIEGIATGEVVQSVNRSEVLLDIDDLSDFRPLPEAARREIISRSPTLQKQTIC